MTNDAVNNQTSNLEEAHHDLQIYRGERDHLVTFIEFVSSTRPMIDERVSVQCELEKYVVQAVE